MIIRVESASSRCVAVRVPAKVNVALAIRGRRPDGYHEIDTVMLPISLADRLSARRVAGERVTLAVTVGPRGLTVGPDNTVLRAAAALGGGTRPGRGAALALRKAIPVGAGLGGGSADAAAALAALNRLWRCRVSGPGLRSMAATIGSDVPFFLGVGAARARGRGERLSPVACPRRFHLVLVYPGYESSTRGVYGALRRFRPWERRASVRMGGLLRALRTGDPEALARSLFNDLEAPARFLNPRLGVLRSRLERLPFLGVGMSGSGSSYFGICRDAGSAQALAREVNARRIGRAWPVEAG